MRRGRVFPAYQKVCHCKSGEGEALFLFDEIGGGTEPVEGAALAQSILESLLAPGMTTVATTPCVHPLDSKHEVTKLKKMWSWSLIFKMP